MAKKIFDILPPKTLSPELGKIAKEKISQRKIPERKIPQKPVFLKKIFLFLFLILILILASFHFLFAKVEISIWPKTELINLKEKVTVDGKIEKSDFSAKILAGKIFEEEKSASRDFPATGKVLKEEKARGVIRVFNNYHLDQVLVANTRFQPPLEKILYFRTTKRIVIPANSYLDVEVVADRAGPEYNIGPATFSIPGLAGTPRYYSIYGKSSSPMKGGFIGYSQQVSQEDLEKAKNTLLEELKAEGKRDLKAKISEDFILLEEGISQEIIEEKGPAAGILGESFNYNLKIKTKAISFKKSDLERMVQEIILSERENKKIQKESLRIDYRPISVDRDLAKIILEVKASAKIYSGEIDEVSIKKNLLTKSLKEIQFLLAEEPEIKKVQLKTFPFWLKRIPASQEKIEIKLNID